MGQDAQEIEKNYSAEVALAMLPRDRWGALGLNPGSTSGTVSSTIIELPAADCEVILNAHAARDMRVEIVDERFSPVAQFAGADSGTPDTDGGLECLVTWKKAQLASLAGTKIRLLVHLKKSGENQPRLYAIYFRSKEKPSSSVLLGTSWRWFLSGFT